MICGGENLHSLFFLNRFYLLYFHHMDAYFTYTNHVKHTLALSNIIILSHFMYIPISFTLPTCAVVEECSPPPAPGEGGTAR